MFLFHRVCFYRLRSLQKRFQLQRLTSVSVNLSTNQTINQLRPVEINYLHTWTHETHDRKFRSTNQCDYNHNNDNKDKANNNIISLLKYFPVKTQQNIYNWHKTSCWTLTCKNRTHTSCCHTHSVDPSASENSPQHYFLLFVWFDETTQTMFFSF